MFDFFFSSINKFPLERTMFIIIINDLFIVSFVCRTEILTNASILFYSGCC